MRITDALLGEHGTLVAQFDRIELSHRHLALVAEVREQAALLSSALLSHAQLEDELLFDRVMALGGDRDLMVRMADQHSSIAASLALAQGTDDLARARSALLKAVAEARDHFALEERMVFPLAETLLGERALHELGAVWGERRAVWLTPAG